MIVGDNPNYQEDNKGEYGYGNAHKLLLELLYAAGLSLGECYYTPAVKCRKSDKGKVSASQLKECKAYLIEELSRVNPEYVITLGSTALKAVTNKAKITEVHGGIIEHKDGFKVLPTFHPAMSLRDPRHWESIHTDFRKFGKIIRGEELRQHNIKVTRVTDEKGLHETLRAIRTSKVVAFDLETNGLQMRYRTSEIGQTVISTFRMNYVVEHECFTKKQMTTFHKRAARLLSGKEVVAQNGKFDNLWLYYMYGVRFPLTFDTMLASHLLDENSPNGLKQNARSILEAEDWDVHTNIKKGIVVPTKDQIKELKTRMGLKPRVKGAKEEYEEEWESEWIKIIESNKLKRAHYAGSDGYYTIRLYKYFKEKLSQDPDLNTLFRELVMPVARTYEQLEMNGVYVDLEKMNEADLILSRRIRRITRKLNRIAKSYLSEEMDINWNSADQVSKVLFHYMNLTPAGYTDGGEPSTAEDNLVKMKNDHKIIPVLLEYRGAFKQWSGFIEGWKKRMIGGQLFPGFKVAGTVTGRPSCSDPNLQQVPRDPFIRSLIGAPPGWVFFEVDYSQVELRIAAAVSGEPTMLQIFRNGGDIHEATYMMVFGITPEEAVAHIKDEGERKAQLKEERKKAKAVNFGFIYGMGWKKFREYALTKFGLKVTDAEAKRMRKRYFETYPGLVDWHDRQRRIVRSLGQVRTHTGRIRHLPQIDSPDSGLSSEAERNAINAPVQGFGAEMILMSLVEVNEYFGNHLLKVQGTIHDAMVGIVREDVAEAAMSRIKEIMESPRIMKKLGIELPLPIIADVSLGNWGIGKEYKPEDLPPPIELGEDYEPLAA